MQTIDDETRAKLAGKVIVASVSGGKDSAAMSLWLTENGIEHQRVFADTGWEHALTYEYLRGELARVIGPIVEVRGDHDMVSLVRKKGMFPSRKFRFCTQFLKVEPLLAHMDAIDEEVVNAIGIRAEESEARAKLPAWEEPSDRNQIVWRPMLAWTEAEVIEIHKRHGLAPNPLYLKGATRVGCFPCINAQKKEIRLVAEIAPERIAEIERMERDVAAAAEARYAEKGETFESKGLTRPTFFQARTPDVPGGRRGMWPIGKAVEWSKTAHGGKRLELFHDPHDGCARWGMCEGPGKAPGDGDK